MLPITLWLYLKYGRPSARGIMQRPTNSGSHSLSGTSRRRGSPYPAASPTHESYHDHAVTNTDHSQSTSPYISGPTRSKAIGHHCHATNNTRPMLVIVLVGVSHCGAGCVLGDIVGEWVVHATGIIINGRELWPALLIDYLFALLCGIAFQYFSIAPLSGEHGWRTVWRAAKADFLSLTSFEVGAFGWIIIYQVAIFDYKLSMLSWTYWW